MCCVYCLRWEDSSKKVTLFCCVYDCQHHRDRLPVAIDSEYLCVSSARDVKRYSLTHFQICKFVGFVFLSFSVIFIFTFCFIVFNKLLVLFLCV